jgi:hypothetical protein
MIPKHDRLSWHFLERRAQKRAKQIRRWQQQMRTGEVSASERLIASHNLLELGIGAYDVIDVDRQGKYDARYWVYVRNRIA